MELSKANDLLNPGYLASESGYWDLADGKRLVAALTRMPGSRGKMVHWWFSWLGGTEQYKLWHPRDHVFSDWENRQDGNYVGASHLVHEYLAGPSGLCSSYASTFTIRRRCSTRAVIARRASLRCARASAISSTQ